MTQVGGNTALKRIPGPTAFVKGYTVQPLCTSLCSMSFESRGSEKRSMNVEATQGLGLIKSEMSVSEAMRMERRSPGAGS